MTLIYPHSRSAARSHSFSSVWVAPSQDVSRGPADPFTWVIASRLTLPGFQASPRVEGPVLRGSQGRGCRGMDPLTPGPLRRGQAAGQGPGQDLGKWHHRALFSLKGIRIFTTTFLWFGVEIEGQRNAPPLVIIFVGKDDNDRNCTDHHDWGTNVRNEGILDGSKTLGKGGAIAGYRVDAGDIVFSAVT